MGPKAQALMGLALVMGVAAGCTTGRATARPSPDASSERRAMTLVNLHPDEARARLTTVNYQQEGLIPVCTPVTFVDEHRKYVAFAVDATGREYRYWLHRALREPFADHLALYFGDACDRAAIDRLGPRDQEGIRTGTVSPGMTKRGVIFALGYPPSHANPGTDADEWRYWQNRFRTFVVHFEDGRVARVQH